MVDAIQRSALNAATTTETRGGGLAEEMIGLPRSRPVADPFVPRDRGCEGREQPRPARCVRERLADPLPAKIEYGPVMKLGFELPSMLGERGPSISIDSLFLGQP